MSDGLKTAVMVAVAAALVGAVYLTRATPSMQAAFSDVGEEFFAGFTDPLAARSLEVVEFDEATAAFRPFKVEFDGTRWRIPSHHNYPATADRNMGEAAALFIGMKKEAVVANEAARHQELGVLEPMDDSGPLTGRGMRVTIRGEGGAVLSDLIVGLEVEGQPGRRYVRVPGRNRVYAATFPRMLSTRFADWVQTDLLRVVGDFEQIRIDRYSIDERAGVKRTEEIVDLKRNREEAPTDPMAARPAEWLLTSTPGGPLAEGERVSLEAMTALLDAIHGLRIVGVRPRPERLVRFFAGDSGDSVQLEPMDLMSLQSRGFYVTQQGAFLANEGELTFGLEDGVVYTLYFGEVLFGEGETITSGRDEAPGRLGAPGAAGPEGEASGRVKESRYLFVTVALDESRLSAAAVKPERPTITEGMSDDEIVEAKEAFEQAELDYAMASQQRARRMEMVNKRVDTLRRAFADWYYVIDGESFVKLRPTRADLVTTEPEDAGIGDIPVVLPPLNAGGAG